MHVQSRMKEWQQLASKMNSGPNLSSKKAGFYTARVSVQTPGMPVAVNVNTDESDVRCLTIEEAQNIFGDTEIVYAESDEALAAAVAQARPLMDFSRFFLFAGLGMLLIECLLADRLLRKKTKAIEAQAEEN